MAKPTAAEIELASRLLSRRRLLPFTQRINPRYLAGWVHEDICRRLEKFSDDVIAGKSPRLMILMPPRHGKSELGSRMFPAWHLGRAPDHEVIACSYNVGLAMSFSRKVKEVLEDPAYHPVFETRLNPDFQGAEEWGVQGKRGGYVAAGVGGGITGKGAHILTIDDPIKNAEEADSADNREKLKEWYDSTAYTRLAPGGGVLIVQCMVGDTPVRLPDGSEKRLDEVRAGDVVATYENGELTASRVAAWKSNGRDNVFTITTSSGKIVRANGRHPFLVSTTEGLRWVRTNDLTTDHKIVALKGSGGSGKASSAPLKAASCPSTAGGCVPPTTVSKSGLTDTGRPPSTQRPSESGTSNTGTASRAKRMIGSWLSRAANALSVVTRPSARLPTGVEDFASTTATKPAKFVDCYATAAILLSGIQKLNVSRSPWPNTSEFTADRVVSIESTGVEEVFDVQIDRTENFIANGLVSHNTWWHDDDLAGRLQVAMAADPEADQFTVIKYPAIAETDEYLDFETDLIVDSEPANGKLLRLKGEALHPARYDIQKLNQIKRTISTRFWSALYQQNPVPDDGSYFLKEHFRRQDLPPTHRCNVLIAWDFAISEKKTNDYTVGTVGLQDENDQLHIADIVRFKSGDSLFIIEAILNLAKKWYSPAMQIGFEDGQIFRAIESLLKKRMRERSFYPSTVTLKPISDKLARARPLQGRMQQGAVSFATSADWYDVCRTEMLRFPAGAHDDQVDSLSWMVQMSLNSAAPRRAEHKQPASWRDKLKTGGSKSFMAA
jgi:predicted phage terminase large subunit-like protein